MKKETITVIYKEVEFDLEFYSSPEEKQFFNYKEGYGSPGCAAEVEITEIKHQGTCFMEWFEDDDMYEELVQKIFEAREAEREY